MIAGRFEGIGQIFEEARALMLNGRSFPMHQARRGNDFAAKDLANALIAETNSEDRNLRSEHANNFVADPGILRAPGTGRYANPLGSESFGLGDGDFIVSFHLDVTTEHGEVLDQVVGKRI